MLTKLTIVESDAAPELVTISEAVLAFGVSRTWVRNKIVLGGLDVASATPGSPTRITRRSLLQLRSEIVRCRTAARLRLIVDNTK